MAPMRFSITNSKPNFSQRIWWQHSRLRCLCCPPSSLTCWKERSGTSETQTDMLFFLIGNVWGPYKIPSKKCVSMTFSRFHVSKKTFLLSPVFFFSIFGGMCFIPNFCIYFIFVRLCRCDFFSTFSDLPIGLGRLWECHDPPSSQASYLLKFQEWMANFSAADLQRRTGIQHSTETVNASLLQTHSITQNIMKLFGKKWEGRKPTGFGIFLVLKNWDVWKDLGIWRFQ